MKMSTKEIDDELTQPLVDDSDYDEEDLVKKPTKKSSTTVKKTRSGMPCCCKCILITFAILMALGVVMTMVAYHCVSDAVQHLTVTTPHAPYPIVDMTEKELEVVEKRVELFVDQILAGNSNIDDLVVTQDEINGFVGHSDYLRGNLLVTLREGGIIEEYSLPTEMLPGGQGRYFVGDDYMKIKGDQIEVKMETAATHHDWFDGPLLFAQLQYLVNTKNHLELYLTKGSFFGQVAPQEFIDERQNLLEDFYNNNDPDSQDAKVIVEGIDHVRIENGKIVVVPRKH